MGRLDDKVAVITGAGRGIGRDIAIAMATEGARIVVNDLGGNTDGTGSGMIADDVVDDAVRAQLSRGTVYSISHELELELAEELVDRIPCAERQPAIRSVLQAAVRSDVLVGEGRQR